VLYGVRVRWVEVTNQESGNKWMVDMDWLLSGYHCIWGKGCKGAHHSSAGSDSGCCGIGVTCWRDDRKRVRRVAKRLRPEDWQEYGKRRLFTIRQRSFQTRLRKHADGSKSKCIFYNDADFGKPGCALHVAAQSHGENYIDWKPRACSNVPIAAVWDDVMQAFVLRLIRSDHDWTGTDYWCGDDPEAYQNDQHTFMTMADELEYIVNWNDPGAWDNIRAKCEAERDRLPMSAGQRVILRPSVR